MFQPKTQSSVLSALKTYGPASGSAKMLEWQFQHAHQAMQSGIYVTFANDYKKSECFRIGSNSRCFCGHSFKLHQKTLTKKKLATGCSKCECKAFKFIPRRPEEVGMYWLVRRKGFDITQWRAPCKCKHGHNEHVPNMSKRCKKCGCFEFTADFACLSCDGAYGDHQMVYELEHDRLMQKKSIREGFFPLSDNPEIQAEFIKKMEEKKDSKGTVAAGVMLGIKRDQQKEEQQDKNGCVLQFQLNPMRAKGVPPVKYAIPTKIKESQLRPAYAPASKKISSKSSALMK